MKKLSDSAKLYLKDYYILSNLQNEIHEYLDDILSEFDEKLNEKYVNIDENNNRISWLNNSSKGELYIYPERIIKIDKKLDLKMPSIKYTDARFIKDEFPDKIILSINLRKDTKAQMTKNKIVQFDNTILNSFKISINVDNREDTINELLDKITKIIDKFKNVINKMNE